MQLTLNLQLHHMVLMLLLVLMPCFGSTSDQADDITLSAMWADSIIYMSNSTQMSLDRHHYSVTII